MHRQEDVDERKERADARGPRLEPRVAQQRVEPDESPAGLRETLRLERQALSQLKELFMIQDG